MSVDREKLGMPKRLGVGEGGSQLPLLLPRLDEALEELADQIDDVSVEFELTVEEGDADKVEVTIQAKDHDENNLEKVLLLAVWLSDDDGGVGLTDNTVDDLDVKTGEGAVFGTLTADKALVVQTKADGSLVLEIEDTDNDECYVGAVCWGGFAQSVSEKITSGDYGE